MRLLIFGPQGVGKGTQAGLLSALWSVPHVSTGDLFRNAMRSPTELGEQLRSYVDTGVLVPDELTQSMLSTRLKQADTAERFLLDGFPRTRGQAEWLEANVLGEHSLDAVIVLSAPRNVLIQRALLRGRADDTAEAVNRRLDLYFEQSEPLLDYYGPLCVHINGNRPVPYVHHDIVEAVDGRLSRRPAAP